MNRWLKTVQTLAYPYVCAVCHGNDCNGLDLCTGCRSDLPLIQHACSQCGLAMPPGSFDVCGQCQSDPPDFNLAYVPYQYSRPVDRLIQGLKFNARLNYARIMGELLADSIRNGKPVLPECLIPVPLHAKRLRERGFNQSQLIAEHLGKCLDIAVDSRSVTRILDTSPQMELPARLRRKNIRGAFAVNDGLTVSRVALVDDVMTTGSTLREMARGLSRSGIEHIQVWCVARA